MRRSLLSVTLAEGESLNVGGASIVYKKYISRNKARILILADKEIKITRVNATDTQVMLDSNPPKDKDVE